MSEHSDLHFRLAHDSREAVEYISQAVSDLRNIVVNRSSLVVNELKPGLEKRGFRISQPYYADFDSFENSMGDCRDLPGLLEKGIVGNFEISGGPANLSSTPRRESPVRDCVAVLGVSAAAAEDGSVYFLQHATNISKSLAQARHVILVVGLDKLVPTRDDAAFQTGCLGIFGLEGLLLNLGSGKGEGEGIENLPQTPEGAERTLHLVLLDNGRSRILRSDWRDLPLCIGCKACVTQCPINKFMNRDRAVWSPRDHLFMSLLGQGQSLDVCLHCETCRVQCPLSIDIPRLMWLFQSDRARRRGRSLQERALGNPELLASAGTWVVPLSNALIRKEPARTLVSSGLSLDRRRALPRFHRQSFRNWLAKRDAQQVAVRGKVAYYVGCYSNYWEPEVARAVYAVLKRNGIEVVMPPQKCCGLPMVANKNLAGFLRNAEYNIASLSALVAEGYDVVTGCPSCALMIKQNYPAFCRNNLTGLVCQRTYYIDEYLLRLRSQGILGTDLAEMSQSVYYHVPCHLKVGGLLGDGLEVLRLIPGLKVIGVNSACCGMGGYHGYKKAYSQMAMDIGDRLFAEIRTAHADRVVTACAACRLQIEAGTGIKALHPIQLLDEACRPVQIMPHSMRHPGAEVPLGPPLVDH